jgi:NADH dehydrogenase
MILIAGATNFVGRAVARQLAAQEREIRCLVQPSRYQQELPTELSFSTVSASLTDRPALRTAMQDVTVIIHLTREEDHPQERPLQSHVEGTANLLEAAQVAGVTRFIYLSRLGATPASAYPLFRIKGESEIMIHESGLDYTTLRAAVVYGADDAFTTRLVMLAKMFPLLLPIPDVGMARFQPLWVEDLARCIVAAIDRDDLIGRMVTVGGPEHYTIEQMIRRVLEAAGMRRYLLHVSMPIMRAASDSLGSLLARNPTPMWWLDLAAAGSATELGAIPKHFNFEPGQFAQCLSYLRRRRPWRRQFIRYILGYG